MVHFPNVQRKAQAELDEVVGPDRLPDFTDIGRLPYCSAIVKELMRWMIVAPLCTYIHDMHSTRTVLTVAWTAGFNCSVYPLER